MPDAPPLLSSAAPTLPVTLTSFVGRQREVAQIKQLLAAGRLVTLTGSGGVGKTRLALAVATDLLSAYADGVRWVDLAALGDPGLVPSVVAAVLDVQERGDQSVLATLLAGLRHRQQLLILDNCEHLVAVCAELVDALLRGCPELRIVATSREPLRIAGEIPFRVPSLSLPTHENETGDGDLETLAGTEAVALFVERTVSVLPGFSLDARNAGAIVQICRRLDGVPLALELAAARVPVLGIEQLAGRLHNRFQLLTGGSRTALPRQQTLRATLDWSHDLLTEAERVLFRRLAVFAGAFTLEAAEAVAGDGMTSGDPADPTRCRLAAADILELLVGLVDKSLVQVEEDQAGATHYRLLETMRQYGWQRLVEAGEALAVGGRHRDWYLALAERAEPELWGGAVGVWLNRLEAEHDNLRAALAWCLDHDPAAGLRLAAALWWFWFLRDHIREGQGWLQRAAATTAPAPAAARAVALVRAGHLAWRLGDYANAAALSEAGLALHRAGGDQRGNVDALVVLGSVAGEQGQQASARRYLDESVSLARSIDEPITLAWALFHRGRLAYFQADYTTAWTGFSECLTIFQGTGTRALGAFVRTYLGSVATGQTSLQVARTMLEEGLAIKRALRLKRGMAIALIHLGLVARLQHDYSRARECASESLALLRHSGDNFFIVLALEGQAGLLTAQGHLDLAARLFGAAEAIRSNIGAVLPPARHLAHEHDLAAVRAGLGPVPSKDAWEAGQAMSVEQALTEALASDASLAAPAHPAPMAAPYRASSVLSDREQEVALLIRQGLMNRQIAAQLSISPRTVERHVSTILTKLSLATRAQIAAWVVEQDG